MNDEKNGASTKTLNPWSAAIHFPVLKRGSYNPVALGRGTGKQPGFAEGICP